MFSLFNFSSIFRGESADPMCPYVRTPMTVSFILIFGTVIGYNPPAESGPMQCVQLKSLVVQFTDSRRDGNLMPD